MKVASEILCDPLSLKAQSSNLVKPRERVGIVKAFNIQEENIDRGDRTKVLSSLAQKVEKATMLSKDTPNDSLFGAKGTQQKVIFKDNTKGILIKKSHKAHSKAPSMTNSPRENARNTGSVPPSKGNEEVSLGTEPKRDGIKEGAATPLDKMTRSGLASVKSPKKVTFAIQIENNRISPELCSMSSKRIRKQARSKSDIKSDVTEVQYLNEKFNPDNLRRGPRLISDALLSGMSNDLLYKEAKAPVEDTLDFSLNAVNVDAKFNIESPGPEASTAPKIEQLQALEDQKKSVLKEGSLLKLPHINSASVWKKISGDLSPISPISTKANNSCIIRKENSPFCLETSALKSPEAIANAINLRFKSDLRKNASFTAGRNRTRELNMNLESERKRLGQLSSFESPMNSTGESYFSQGFLGDSKEAQYKRPILSIFKRQQSFSK